MVKLNLDEEDLHSMFDKKQLEFLLETQIKFENYEGALMIKNVLDDFEAEDEFDEYGEDDLLDL